MPMTCVPRVKNVRFHSSKIGRTEVRTSDRTKGIFSSSRHVEVRLAVGEQCVAGGQHCHLIVLRDLESRDRTQKFDN